MKDAKNEWNEKIMKITMRIKDQYPELSKYLNEMPVTIPNEKNPEITLRNLKNYFDSLKSMLETYTLGNEVYSETKK